MGLTIKLAICFIFYKPSKCYVDIDKYLVQSIYTYVYNAIHICTKYIIIYVVMHYDTAQMQVDGLAQVLVLALEYSRTNTRVEHAGIWHEHDRMEHGMSSNQWVEICRSIFQILKNLLENSPFTLTSTLLASIKLYLSSTVCITYNI